MRLRSVNPMLLDGLLAVLHVASALVMVVVLHIGIALAWRNQGAVNLTDLPYNWLLFGLPVVLGYGVRNRRAYAAQLEELNRLRRPNRDVTVTLDKHGGLIKQHLRWRG